MQYLSLQDCLRINRVDKLYYVSKTDINPQTGKAYAINPATNQWDDNYWANTVDPQVNAAQKQQDAAKAQSDAAQAQYQQQQGSAIAGLQQKKTDLGSQYSDLLKTVNSQYQPLINQETSQENSFLGQRGLLSQDGKGGNEMSQALSSVYGQEAGNAQAIGQGSVNDTNTIAQAIANLQSGGAQFGAQLPLQYGSLALQQAQNPANIFSTYSQGSAAGFIPIPGIGVYNMHTGQIVNTLGGAGGQGPTLNYTGNLKFGQ